MRTARTLAYESAIVVVGWDGRGGPFAGCASDRPIMLGADRENTPVMREPAGARAPVDIEAARLSRSLEALNDLNKHSARETVIVQGDARNVQRREDADLQLPNLIPGIAYVLSMNEQQANNLLVHQGVPLGDVAMARFISERSGTAIQDVLKMNPGRDWARTLRQLKLPVSDATAYANEVYNEVAFHRIDRMSR